MASFPGGAAPGSGRSCGKFSACFQAHSSGNSTPLKRSQETRFPNDSGRCSSAIRQDCKIQRRNSYRDCAPINPLRCWARLLPPPHPASSRRVPHQFDSKEHLSPFPGSRLSGQISTVLARFPFTGASKISGYVAVCWLSHIWA